MLIKLRSIFLFFLIPLFSFLSVWFTAGSVLATDQLLKEQAAPMQQVAPVQQPGGPAPAAAAPVQQVQPLQKAGREKKGGKKGDFKAAAPVQQGAPFGQPI